MSDAVSNPMKALRKPAECESMDHVRVEIDRIDNALIDLIAQRWGYVDRAWALKTDIGQAWVPWRIQQVIDRVRDQAESQGVPPQLAEALWRQLIGWGIQYESEKILAKIESD